jgi:hypothetical protein
MGPRRLVFLFIEEHASEQELGPDIAGVRSKRGVQQPLGLGELIVVETQSGEIVEQRGVAVAELEGLGKEFQGAGNFSDPGIRVGRPVQGFGQKEAILGCGVAGVAAREERRCCGKVLMNRIGRSGRGVTLRPERRQRGCQERCRDPVFCRPCLEY